MKNKLFLFSFILISFTCLSQKPFSGELIYKGTMNFPDTNLVYKSWDVKLFTNDTIVRVETQTDALGNQVYIRNIAVGKAYLLIDMDGQKFAIQTDLNKKKAADTTKIAYTHKKKLFGGKTINGIKCKKYHIVYSDKIEFDCYFAKNISNKYLEIYENIPGLAVDYYIPNEDGLIHYQLTKIEEKKVDRNLFGIPSDFKRVSFEEFMKSMGLSE